jgi:hypothetical protein
MTIWRPKTIRLRAYVPSTSSSYMLTSQVFMPCSASKTFRLQVPQGIA